MERLAEAAGSVSYAIVPTANSGARLVVKRGADTILTTLLKRRCSGERLEQVREVLPAIVAEHLESTDADTWQISWDAANSVLGNSSWDPETRLDALQRGRGWNAGTPMADHVKEGYTALKGALPEEARATLLALAARECHSRQPRVHAALHNAARRGARKVSLLYGEDAAGAATAEGVTVLPAGSPEEAAVRMALDWVRSQTACAARGKLAAREGLLPRNANTVTLLRESAGDGSGLGLWHGDNHAHPNAAVAIGLDDDGWVPPFFVEVRPQGLGGSEFADTFAEGERTTYRGRPRPTPLDKQTYAKARSERWRKVIETDNRNERIAARGPSGALCSSSASGTPLSLPGRNCDGIVRYARVWGQGRPGRSPAQEPRPKWKAGTGLMFDASSPHRTPGAMTAEGARHVLYIGYASLPVFEAGYGAPCLAHPAPIGEGLVSAPETRWDEEAGDWTEGLWKRVTRDARGSLVFGGGPDHDGAELPEID